MMLSIIPILVFVAIFLNLYGHKQEGSLDLSDWRGPFLQACLIWGGLVVLFSEILSLFSALSQFWVAVIWGLALTITFFIGWQRGVFRTAWDKIKRVRTWSIGRADGLILISMAVIVIVLWFIALRSPPNNTDSLLYHMSRIVHWAQNKSLRHYSTYYEHQLINPIWAETAILNLRLLWGNDHPANLVQWFSMLGSLVGVSALAGLLGVKRRGQLLAAAFAISIPMGILQSTSTQNDYITAFWLVCLIYFVLLSKKRNLEPSEWLSLSLATGLGMLTKGTFYPFAFPILLWLFIPNLIQRGLRWTIGLGVGMTAVVLVLNLGFWLRNLLTYGGPLGPQDYISITVDASINPQSWISGLAKQIMLNFATPSPEVNASIVSGVNSLRNFLGIEVDNYGLIWSWNHEDLAGNPFHFLAIILALFLIVMARHKLPSKSAFGYSLIVFSSFLLFSAIVRFDYYGVRYQLPFLVLCGVVLGVASSLIRNKKVITITSALMILASTPWLLLNRSRPLIDMRPRTMTGSILQEPPTTILFANWTKLREPYVDVAQAIKSSDCQEIGLRIDSGDLEYPYLWLLEAPQSGIRIEVVDTYPRLERYLDQNFKPCAIICSICGKQETLYGLERQGDFGSGIVLFSNSENSADEGE